MKLASCKSALNPPPPHPVVYSTDRSKAVVPVLVLLFVALWFILWGDLFYVLTLCYFVLVFFSPFSIATTSLGEERANLRSFLTFVRFVLVWFYRFSLPLGVWKELRFVIVALPGLFSYLFFILRGDLFYVLPCVILFLCFFSVLLALRLPRLGKRELILVLFVRLFDLCLFGFFGFPLGVWEGLRFVIVAIPGLFSYLFLNLTLTHKCLRNVSCMIEFNF